MGDLSEHFNRDEFRCRGEDRAMHPAHDVLVDEHLVDHLETLRALAGGQPLRIVSGHRCRWYNERVGGAAGSQHVQGAAADIPAGYATVTEAEAAGFTGVGSTGAWAVHVDVRDLPARWSY